MQYCSFQFVLFIGVTLLLASTYVTINKHDTAAVETEAVQEIAQDIAKEQPVPPPIEVEDDNGAGDKQDADGNYSLVY